VEPTSSSKSSGAASVQRTRNGGLLIGGVVVQVGDRLDGFLEIDGSLLPSTMTEYSTSCGPMQARERNAQEGPASNSVPLAPARALANGPPTTWSGSQFPPPTAAGAADSVEILRGIITSEGAAEQLSSDDSDRLIWAFRRLAARGPAGYTVLLDELDRCRGHRYADVRLVEIVAALPLMPEVLAPRINSAVRRSGENGMWDLGTAALARPGEPGRQQLLGLLDWTRLGTPWAYTALNIEPGSGDARPEARAPAPVSPRGFRAHPGGGSARIGVGRSGGSGGSTGRGPGARSLQGRACAVRVGPGRVRAAAWARGDILASGVARASADSRRSGRTAGTAAGSAIPQKSQNWWFSRRMIKRPSGAGPAPDDSTMRTAMAVRGSTPRTEPHARSKPP
jgi:hypothetical protein